MTGRAALVTAALTKVGVIAVAAAIALVVIWVGWELFLMTRKKCPDCAKGIEKSANVCPHCGYRFSPSPGANQ
jgi:predicted amidophosphoribosyltransferase